MITVHYSVENWVCDIFENGVSFHEDGTFLYIQDDQCLTIACVNKNFVRKVILDNPRPEVPLRPTRYITRTDASRSHGGMFGNMVNPSPPDPESIRYETPDWE